MWLECTHVEGLGFLFNLLNVILLSSFTTPGRGGIGTSRPGHICVCNISVSFGSSLICVASIRCLSDVVVGGSTSVRGCTCCSVRVGICLRNALNRAGRAYTMVCSSGGGGLRGHCLGVHGGCHRGGGMLLGRVNASTFSFHGR